MLNLYSDQPNKLNEFKKCCTDIFVSVVWCSNKQKAAKNYKMINKERLKLFIINELLEISSSDDEIEDMLCVIKEERSKVKNNEYS